MPQDLSVDWHVQHLRFSVFLPQPAQPEPVGFWANVVGQDADDTHIKGTGSQRVVTQQGPFRDARMRAEVRIDRVDWFLGPSLPPTSDDMPVAGPYDGLIDPFLACMRVWLDAAGLVVHRMAFGAQLSLRQGNRSEALTVLADLLATVEMDTRNTWDFEYTVNRRRTASVMAGLMINRVAKWSLGRQVSGAVELAFNGSPPRMQTATAYLPVLTLDANTIPEHHGPLERLGELLAEDDLNTGDACVAPTVSGPRR